MGKAARLFWTAVLMTAAGTSAFAAGSPQTLNLPESPANYVFDDEDEPEVTARVARISYISGEARIRRAGVEDWERASLNLPLVEGDEIVTDNGARIELQFAKDQHLRLSENAYLKLTTFRDEGIAVSLGSGTMALRLITFDRDKTFFEIDAPKTTIAIQGVGNYRVDAGNDTDSEIRVTAFDGEARVYSETSGFMLRSGRSSRIFLEGVNAGEWETAAARYGDDFDQWTASRDALIASQLSNAFYNTYYDDDIYGADDLNSSGDWVYMASYGRVWRPWQSSIVRYADWSPYRYGQWRWMPPFGWIWVNDEPWGWATYHHGRWFHNNGYWYWSPYGFYRPRRSWWYPALVSINIFGGNTCWYPLSYRHRWRNNRWDYAGYKTNRLRSGATPPPIVRDPKALGGRKEPPSDDEDTVPPIGVVAIDSKKFGTGARPIRLPVNDARTIVARKGDDDVKIRLPGYEDIRPRITNDIAAEKPKAASKAAGTRIGAGTRKPDAPLDNELKTKTITGGRPMQPVDVPSKDLPADKRKPGIFDRPPVEVKEPQVIREVPKVKTVPTPVEPQVKELPKVKVSPTPSEPQTKKETPRYVPPVVKETPRVPPSPPVRPVERPKSDPVPSRPAPKETPPVKTVPKPEKKPPPKDDGDAGVKGRP